MRTKLGLVLALLWLGSALAAPALSLRWEGRALRVERTVEGCLWLKGGNLEDRRLDIPCTAATVLLPTGDVDHLDAPQRREWVELRRPDGTLLARAKIEWIIILPLMVKSP